MKLKTLKELETHIDSHDFVIYDNIREESKKWIEELEKGIDNLESDDDWIEKWIRETSYRGNWDRDALIYWIKHFFNLEDE